VSHPEPASTGSADTILTIWAHYDDDLVFANPRMLRALESGSRVHTFFLTASDAGAGISRYADGREAGIRAAYDDMRQGIDPWTERTITLPNGVTLTLTHPMDDDRVSLSFLRLADGGLRGIGYDLTGWQSLPKLLNGELPSMMALDDAQDITLDLLRSTILHLVDTYRPTTIITNHPGYDDEPCEDHPDHQTVGRIVASIVEDGGIAADRVRYAVGYPSAGRPANVSPDDLARKLEVFASYAVHDRVFAPRHQPEGYLEVRGFGEWLPRHYLETHAELVIPTPETPVTVEPVAEAIGRDVAGGTHSQAIASSS
jgi:LmbE family N-acetylglucosaminyl deacetylase